MADEIDPRLIAALLAQRGQRPRVPISGMEGPGGEPYFAPEGQPQESGMPGWYQSVQPYPVNAPAAHVFLSIAITTNGTAANHLRRKNLPVSIGQAAVGSGWEMATAGAADVDCDRLRQRP